MARADRGWAPAHRPPPRLDGVRAADRRPVGRPTPRPSARRDGRPDRGGRGVHLDPRHALRVLEPRLGDRRPRDRTGRRDHAAAPRVRAIPDAARHDQHDVDAAGRRQRRRALPVGGPRVGGRARAARRRHDRTHGWALVDGRRPRAMGDLLLRRVPAARRSRRRTAGQVGAPGDAAAPTDGLDRHRPHPPERPRALRRVRLRDRSVDAARSAARHDRHAQRRRPGLRLAHAVAARPQARRGRAVQRHVRRHGVGLRRGARGARRPRRAAAGAVRDGHARTAGRRPPGGRAREPLGGRRCSGAVRRQRRARRAARPPPPRGVGRRRAPRSAEARVARRRRTAARRRDRRRRSREDRARAQPRGQGAVDVGRGPSQALRRADRHRPCDAPGAPTERLRAAPPHRRPRRRVRTMAGRGARSPGGRPAHQARRASRLDEVVRDQRGAADRRR